MELVNKPKILVIDDSAMNRLLFKEILSDKYIILEAENGLEAIKILEQNLREVQVVLLDIVMPIMDGFGVLYYMNKYNIIDEVPVIMISSEQNPEVVRSCYELGVTDFINRPFDFEVVKKRVSNTILLYAKQRKLSEIIADQIRDSERTQNLMVSILSHIVEFRNGESGLHVLHISKITKLLLEEYSRRNPQLKLTKEDITLISQAATLHDIGKIVIPDSILNKPGKLTDEEYNIVKTHSRVGADMLQDLVTYKDEPLMKYAYEICRWHHERWDGGGYPDGLQGEEIPLSAQIVSIADVYDALISVRCYKDAYPHEEAVKIIIENKCGKFNPGLLDSFLGISNSLQKALEDINVKEASIIKRDPKEFLKEELNKFEDDVNYSKNLNILNLEKGKVEFLLDQIDDVCFSYRVEPGLFSLSKNGSKLLGINEVTIDPINSESIKEVFGKTFIKNLINSKNILTQTNNNFSFKTEIKYKEGKKKCLIDCRALNIDGNKNDNNFFTIVGIIKIL